ncbi:MAG: AAA family ATPase [Lachnospiraceae bacterium]|nr:AAA family ATPase [Lachnospiraceae bacterium]
MGNYLNPGNQGFKEIRNGLYVDKTGLIEYINSTINTTPDRLTFVSRPRRFGKSFAAKMLSAYYDKSCDSCMLFKGLRISESKTFQEHLNRYNVIYLDITWFISNTGNIKHLVTDLQECVIRELHETFPMFAEEKERSLPRALLRIAEKTGEKFIIIIDEWDALFREAKNDIDLQKEYVQLLRGLFKGGSATDKLIAAAYMTGILPINKYGTESALTDFQEFTMTDPLILSEYVGFTEKEVRTLCDDYQIDFESMKQWYDGYSFEDRQSVYSPNSVMKATKFRRFKSYWTVSESYESLKGYITKNFDGLKDAIIRMLGGQQVNVEISTFQNDITSFHSKDDVLTLLIHLGYLAYDVTKKKAYIPNLEVADAFKAAVSGTEWKQVSKALEQSEKLFKRF